MKIISQTPCRLSLAGGGTDVYPFAFKYGGQVLSVAIDLYHTVILMPHIQPNIEIQALGEKRQFSLFKLPLAYGEDPKFDLIRAILNFFRLKFPSGFSLEIVSPKQNLLGLGRSSSAAVGIISAINAWLKIKISPLELGLLVFRLETEELSWIGGKQDALAAAFGGSNLMTFGPGEKIEVFPIKLSKKIIASLKQHIFMVFVGGDRHSSKQQQNLIKGMLDQKKLKALTAIKNSVTPAKAALHKANWKLLGQIIDKSWEDKKKSNSLVTNKEIDKFYNLAKRNGAYGGKISGSGGAGHMFFLIPSEKKSTAIKALTQAGAKLVNFDLDFKGVTVKKYDN